MLNEPFTHYYNSACWNLRRILEYPGRRGFPLDNASIDFHGVAVCSRQWNKQGCAPFSKCNRNSKLQTQGVFRLAARSYAGGSRSAWSCAGFVHSSGNTRPYIQPPACRRNDNGPYAYFVQTQSKTKRAEVPDDIQAKACSNSGIFLRRTLRRDCPSRGRFHHYCLTDMDNRIRPCSNQQHKGIHSSHLYIFRTRRVRYKRQGRFDSGPYIGSGQQCRRMDWKQFRGQKRRPLDKNNPGVRRRSNGNKTCLHFMILFDRQIAANVKPKTSAYCMTNA